MEEQLQGDPKAVFERVGRTQSTDDEVRRIQSHAATRYYADGDPLFNVGERDLGVHVITAGAVEVYDKPDDQPRRIAFLKKHQFLGDVAMLTGSAGVLSARAVGDTEALLIDHSNFTKFLATEPELGQRMILAFVARRGYLNSLEDFSGVVRIVGEEDDSRVYQLREFLSRNQVPYQFVESTSKEARVSTLNWQRSQASRSFSSGNNKKGSILTSAAWPRPRACAGRSRRIHSATWPSLARGRQAWRQRVCRVRGTHDARLRPARPWRAGRYEHEYRKLSWRLTRPDRCRDHESDVPPIDSVRCEVLHRCQYQ